MSAHVLMLSSSRKGTESYLQHAIPFIKSHLNEIKNVVFVPYAGVSISWNNYTQMVQQALPMLNIKGIHSFENPDQAIEEAEAIFIGGGNTFNLLNEIYSKNLLTLIQKKVASGTPYVGWSAGSNICGASIKTTNDMPVVEPASFSSLNFIQCQLNPHYSDYQPPNHNGETRDQRIEEFTRINPTVPVLAIREGSALLLSNDRLTLKGDLGGFCFLGDEKIALQPEQDLTQYIDPI